MEQVQSHLSSKIRSAETHSAVQHLFCWILAAVSQGGWFGSHLVDTVAILLYSD